jgi:3-oxoacyl-[acyl-carrier protein] reductase
MGIQLAGKKALVTGGTRGIGRAISLSLAQAGAEVVAAYRQDAEAAGWLRKELTRYPGTHAVVAADVANEVDVERVVRTCDELWGSLDVVVNNAGSISHVAFGELPLAEWHAVVDASLTGTYLVTKAALSLLRDGGSVINIGSRGAAAGLPERGHYTAAKAGLVGLTRSLCKELGSRGIRVNVVAPGVVQTEEWARTDAERVAALQHRYRTLTALGRLGHADEVANVVVFLASDLSSYVTGETINVDGGI